MKILPAIDILDGKCVRLVKGEFDTKKVYSSDPLAVAKKFEQQGAKMLHVVDLDAAKIGKPVNQELILNIVKVVSIPIEVGGGIRDIETARTYLNNGVQKIVIGTRAIDDVAFLYSLIQEFGNNRIVVAVETRKGKITKNGWQENTGKNYLEFAKELKAIGVVEILFTDVDKDGTLTEPNFEAIKKLIDLGIQVIASGGISDLASIKKLNNMRASAVILGKALYENKILLKDALKEVSPISNLTKRIIPCLDVKDGRVVKGVNFKNLIDAGDPVALGKFYSDEGADELVFLDITATLDNRKTLRNLVERIAREINIPFTVGGGIKSISDIRELLTVGADKISIGSVAVKNPAFVKEASEYFGSQCIVISVDAKKKDSSWEIYINGGRDATGVDAISFAKEMEKLGAGELLVNSLDRDGTKKGFDIDLLNSMCDAVNIPVIASSGAGSARDFVKVFNETNVDAALAASIFHKGNISVRDLKKVLQENNLQIRL